MTPAEAWRKANAIADCDCDRTGVASVSDEMCDWAATAEHWNSPEAGHLIAASLHLDGQDCEDIP